MAQLFYFFYIHRSLINGSTHRPTQSAEKDNSANSFYQISRASSIPKRIALMSGARSVGHGLTTPPGSPREADWTYTLPTTFPKKKSSWAWLSLHIFLLPYFSKSFYCYCCLTSEYPTPCPISDDRDFIFDPSCARIIPLLRYKYWFRGFALYGVVIDYDHLHFHQECVSTLSIVLERIGRDNFMVLDS